jgi:hypothetical protein
LSENQLEVYVVHGGVDYCKRQRAAAAANGYHLPGEENSRPRAPQPENLPPNHHTHKEPAIVFMVVAGNPNYRPVTTFQNLLCIPSQAVSGKEVT